MAIRLAGRTPAAVAARLGMNETTTAQSHLPFVGEVFTNRVLDWHINLTTQLDSVNLILKRRLDCLEQSSVVDLEL